MWWRMLLTTALFTLRDVVKNADAKKQLRNVILELYRTIKAAYSDDPEFQQ